MFYSPADEVPKAAKFKRTEFVLESPKGRFGAKGREVTANLETGLYNFYELEEEDAEGNTVISEFVSEVEPILPMNWSDVKTNALGSLKAGAYANFSRGGKGKTTLSMQLLQEKGVSYISIGEAEAGSRQGTFRSYARTFNDALFSDSKVAIIDSIKKFFIIGENPGKSGIPRDPLLDLLERMSFSAVAMGKMVILVANPIVSGESIAFKDFKEQIFSSATGYIEVSGVTDDELQDEVRTQVKTSRRGGKREENNKLIVTKRSAIR